MGREQTIVIKLSMRSRQSNKALIRFNHHEITALRKVQDNSSANADPPSVEVKYGRLELSFSEVRSFLWFPCTCHQRLSKDK